MKPTPFLRLNMLSAMRGSGIGSKYSFYTCSWMNVAGLPVSSNGVHTCVGIGLGYGDDLHLYGVMSSAQGHITSYRTIGRR